jgi:hypothetical protein
MADPTQTPGVPTDTGAGAPGAPTAAAPPVDAGLQPGGIPAAPAPAAPDYEDIRDFAQSEGLDLSSLPDSREAAAYLIRRAREQDRYADVGRQAASDWENYQRWRLGQVSPQPGMPGAAAPPAKRNVFGLPDYDPNWMQMVRKDPVTGDYIPAPGAPPDIVHRVTNYAMQLQAAQQRFWQDPMQFLGELIDQRISPLLDQRVSAHSQYAQNMAEAQRFMTENAGWIHRFDNNGQLLLDPVTKQPMLSSDGAKFAGLLQEAAQMGIASQQQQVAYATRIMRAETGGKTSNPAFNAAVAQGNRTAQDFLAAHNRRPNNAGRMSPPAPGGPPPSAAHPNLSLREKLKMDLDAAGITDADIAAEPG